jgi:hypothetical protein
MNKILNFFVEKKWPFAFFITLVSLLPTYKFTGDPFISAFSAIFVFFFIPTIIHMAQFNDGFPRMVVHLDEVLGAFKNIALFVKDAHEMDHKGIRNISIRFASESLNDICKIGLVKVQEPPKFNDFIKEIIDETKETFFGTSVYRPIELAKDKNIKEYLNIFNKRNYIKITRISVLDANSIADIVKEALWNLKGKKPEESTTHIDDIPEIEWWVKEVHQINYKEPKTPIHNPALTRTLLWTTHSFAVEKEEYNFLVPSKTKDKSVEDYGVFDNRLVVNFWQSREFNKGILFTLWGEERINKYLKTQERIKEIMEHTTCYDFKYLGFYESFYELIKSIKSIGSFSPIDITKRENFKDFEFISEHFKQTDPLDEVYEKIIKLVNEGQARFDSNYMKDFDSKPYVPATNT